MQNEPLRVSTLDHVGVVVKDIESAIRYYQALGIGPFESRKGAPVIERTVRGKPANDVKNISKTAHLGPICLELLQPLSGASVQREFLERRGEGISHLGFSVDDIDREIPKFAKMGFNVVSRVRRADGSGSA